MLPTWSSMGDRDASAVLRAAPNIASEGSIPTTRPEGATMAASSTHTSQPQHLVSGATMVRQMLCRQPQIIDEIPGVVTRIDVGKSRFNHCRHFFVLRYDWIDVAGGREGRSQGASARS